jgi:dTDP-glucose pyrophosphorylase
MRPISFIICAAGAGTRMTAVSAKVQKSFLKLNKKRLLDWSLESLDLEPNDQLIIVHRFDTSTESLEQQLKLKYPGVVIDFLKLAKLTSGQAETAYLAKNLFLHPQIVIFNSDTYFKASALRTTIEENQFDGIIPCFKAEGNSWSFCKTDSQGPLFKVTEVAEKVRISNLCSTGYYYFRKASDFIEAFEKQIQNPNSAERYVAPLYNLLISESKDIRAVECEIFKPMGAPEQIEEYWSMSLQQLIDEN